MIPYFFASASFIIAVSPPALFLSWIDLAIGSSTPLRSSCAVRASLLLISFLEEAEVVAIMAGRAVVGRFKPLPTEVVGLDLALFGIFYSSPNDFTLVSLPTEGVGLPLALFGMLYSSLVVLGSASLPTEGVGLPLALFGTLFSSIPLSFFFPMKSISTAPLRVGSLTAR